MSKIYDSDYSVRLATLEALGGDVTKKYDSVYEIDLAILDIVEHGIGVQIDDNNTSTGTTWSSSKIVAELADAGFDVQVVQVLPATGEAHTLYFVPSSDPQTSNVYDEYLYANNAWEQVGSTAVDMSDYYTADEVDALLDDKAEIVELTQAEYDELTPAEKNNGKIYSITDAVVIDMNNYYTKTQADNAFNPKNTTNANSGSYRFPNWNANGQITGYSTQAYQASQNVNGSSRTLYSTSSTTLPTIYAPTSAGTQGYYLVSSGNGAPVWQALEVASDYVIEDADAAAGTYSSDIAAFYAKTISENIVQGVQIKVVDSHIVAGDTISSLQTNTLFAVEEGASVEVTYTIRTSGTTQVYTIDTEGTIPSGSNIIEAGTKINGYKVYKCVANIGPTMYFSSAAITDGSAYEIDTVTSDSYYLPSSSRIYSGNVELWLMTTEDGLTWQNIHYTITGNSITRDVTNGWFGEHTEPTVPPANEIWYTSWNGTIKEPDSMAMDFPTIVSNTYNDGKGVMVLATDMTSLPDMSFNGVGITSITLSNSVTTLGSESLAQSSLGYGGVDVILNDNITTIGQYAISNCQSLSSITLGSGLTTIGEGALSGNTSLTSISYNGTMAQWANITLGTDWHGWGTPATVVHCTDGDVTL